MSLRKIRSAAAGASLSARGRRRIFLIGRALSASAATLTILACRLGRADAGADELRANALFNTAIQLVASGEVADACPLFAETKRLSPGIGVSLHLADCYERLGRTAHAWQEFVRAEKLARAHGDGRRADLAQKRVQGLEPALERLTLVTTAGVSNEGWQLVLDGVVLPFDHWNAALAVDPGDHTVDVTAPGQAPRALHTHLDANHRSVVMRIDDERDASGSAGVVARAAIPNESGPGALRIFGEVTLTGIAVVGVGFGSFFMVRRAHFIDEGPPADPTLTRQATTAATLSFVTAGAALVGASVLLFTFRALPATRRIGFRVAPGVGGAGALVFTSF
jgi:hypothetical protein